MEQISTRDFVLLFTKSEGGMRNENCEDSYFHTVYKLV